MKKIIRILFILAVFTGKIYGQTLKEHVEKGVELHDKGDYIAALGEYKKALEMDPKSPLANYEMSSTYFAMEEYTKAVEYSDIVIKQNSAYVSQAYIIKGSALDMLGKPKESIKTYKKGIKDSPRDYLLYFNLAFTAYNIKDYKEAEEALQGCLKLNSAHGSSHLLMAYIMKDQEKRVKSVLALYNFLLIEPEGKRAKSAYELLEAQLKKGVNKENAKSTTITLSDNKDADEFSAAELMLSLLEASKNLESNEGKTQEALFADNTNSFFSVLGELKEKNKGFWWDFYVDFFYTMKNKNYVEALSYYVSQSIPNKNVDTWLKANQNKTNALLKWVAEYQRKF